MKTRKYQRNNLLSVRRTVSPIVIGVVAFVILTVVCVLTGFFIQKSKSFLPSVSSLYKDWDAKDYQSVYDKSSLILDKRALDGAVLALHGFSSYYLFVEQTDSVIAQNYLLDSINSLRNAWYRVSASERPQIAYILGKAYYQRGYYYADLSMKYLDYAASNGIKAADLQEFRGLSAALLGDDVTSIAAFAEALKGNSSDLLLFTIAQSYERSDDKERAKQYLYETIRTTKDDTLVLKCHFELGMIFANEKKLPEAQAEFTSILEKEPNSADAHYGLGVIYEAQGDLVKARAEWRKAVKLDPVHAGARAKLNI
jgi:tetratricopeptide (TPR) repeat protein